MTSAAVIIRRLCENLRSEEHTSELQSRLHLVCRLLLGKKKAARAFHPGALRGGARRRAGGERVFAEGMRSRLWLPAWESRCRHGTCWFCFFFMSGGPRRIASLPPPALFPP